MDQGIGNPSVVPVSGDYDFEGIGEVFSQTRDSHQGDKREERELHSVLAQLELDFDLYSASRVELRKVDGRDE